MRIGEVAKRARVSTSRIRFYETRGLLPAAPRDANGYRNYPETAIRTLSFIERAQGLGFSLAEIETALPGAVDQGLTQDAVLAALERKLAEVESHLDASRALRRRLLALIAEQRECLPGQ